LQQLAQINDFALLHIQYVSSFENTLNIFCTM